MSKNRTTLRTITRDLAVALSICLSFVPKSEAQDQRPPGETVQVRSEPKSSEHTLVAIPYPDLSKMDPIIQQQLRNAQSEFISATERAGITATQLGEAYGQLGRFYEAYELWDSALACFLNAQSSDPDRFDWQYYLGYTYQRQGDLNKARVFFDKALEIRPHEPAVLLRLAQVHLDLNHPELARPLLREVLVMNKSSAAALAGLGKVALHERNFAEAVEKFEAALALEPQASSLRYPLALAYRGLGDLAKAEANLKKRGRDEPNISDPLVDQLQDLRMGFFNLWVRGAEALDAGRVAEAVEAYRKMVETSPEDPNAHMYFGIGLMRAGLPDAAVEQFTEALRIAPNHADVHYNFGLLLARRGLEEQAIEHFQAAIKSNPELKDGHFQLANLLMRTGRYEEARQEYSVVVRRDPQNGFARLMEAVALVRLRDYARARAQLEQGLAALPDDTDIASALARLLAACPEKTVRDGPRALRLAARAFKAQQDLDTGETVAMALAEVGQPDQAAQMQRAMIAKVDQLGQSDLARSLRDNLILYEQGKACRTPWRDDDPIFKPVLSQ